MAEETDRLFFGMGGGNLRLGDANRRPSELTRDG